MTLPINSLMTALAPMRDITTRAFCDLFLHYGEPDLYVTEFLRVHLSSYIDSNIVAMLTNRRSARPIFVQLLGREPSEFIRIAKLISRYHVHGIDLNFGCPVPKIHRKGVGGALLEEPQTIDKILSELEQSLKLSVSVKIRIGFENDSIFEKIIDVLAQHNLDHVTIHARTVHDLYREAVNYSYVELAKKMLRCKVFANGDINSSRQACNVAEQTHCDGVMIGRAAVRNPFIFRQISELRMTGRCFMPKLRDLYPYVLRLIDITEKTTSDEKKQVCYMKKYLNFIGQCVDCEGKFLYAARRATNRAELIAAIDFHINERGDEIFHGIPHKNIVARPNCE